MATITLTTSYQKIATINLTYGKIYTYAKYTEQTVSGGKAKTTYKIKSEYALNQWIEFSSATAKLDGTSKTYGYTHLNSGTTTLQELTRTLTHNADGTSPTKSISTSWSATSGGSGSSSGSIKAPTKKVIATMTNATDFDDTSSPTLTFNNPSDYYVRPYINIYPNSTSTSRIKQVTGTIAKHSSPYTWDLTSEMTGILNACNTQTTYSVAEGIQTFTSSSEASLIENSANSIRKTFTIVNANPYIDFTVLETNEDVVDLLGSSSANKIIRNASKLKITATPTLQKGATLQSINISGLVNGTITSSPYELEQTVGNSGSLIKAEIVDSRNLTSNAITMPTQIIDYQKVKKNSFSFKRVNPTSSDIRLLLDSVYYQQTFGTYTNAPVVSYKKENDVNWTPITLTNENSEIDNENHTLTVDYTITNALSYTSGDTFYIKVEDLLSSWTDSNKISKGVPVFEFGDDEVQVNGSLLLADTSRENAIEMFDLTGTPRYDSSENYSVGDYCIYDDSLYKCTNATTGTFDVNDWTSTDIMSEIGSGGGGGGTSDYTQLSNKPQINGHTLTGNMSTSDIGITIPTVNDATLTIQKNGTTVNTFTANASSNVTANITVPTDNNELTNGAGYVTKSVNDLTNYTLSSALSTVATSGDYDDLDNKPTIKGTTNTNSQKSVGWYGNASSIISDINSTNYTTPNEYTFVITSSTSNIPSDLVSLLTSNQVAVLKTYSTTLTIDAFAGVRQELFVPRLTKKYWYRHITGTNSTPTFGSWYEVATTDDIPTIPTNYVTTDTTQDVTGEKTFKNVMNIQNGQGTGSLWVGGDVNATTLTNNTRHLARVVVPTYSDVTKGATLLGFDSSGDSDMHVTNKGSDAVSFGGMKKITNATSPMAIGFCVATERNGMTSAKKVYPMEMDSSEVRFNVQPNYNGTNLATVNDHDSTKQDTLVSGTNIKTINNTSILGSGNISIGGGGTATDVKINGTSITSGGEADIITEGTYNSSTNKIATMSDIPVSDVQIGGTSILSSGVANIRSTGTYNATSNKLVDELSLKWSTGVNNSVGDMIWSSSGTYKVGQLVSYGYAIYRNKTGSNDPMNSPNIDTTNWEETKGILDIVRDTGWVNLTYSAGTWTYLRYRVVGKMVYVEGYASALQYSGSTLTIVNTTNAIPSAYRPEYTKYFYGFIGGSRMCRMWVNTNGTIGLDWSLNISNGSNYTTSNWCAFSYSYMID